VDVKKVASQVLELLEYTNKKITVAVMGCPVNGPGEAKHADIGLAGGKKKWVLFKKGQVIDTIDEKDAFTRLKKEIESFK
jgi:(E)-4-hydroxy-3-methylbut-2-enyl-diphosphate synthase